jgi:hypothetical protein
MNISIIKYVEMARVINKIFTCLTMKFDSYYSIDEEIVNV